MIKRDKSKILSESGKKGNKLYILKSGTKLSEVFTKLPCGIVNKTETGIGATTLELEAIRNSIIVEPIRITASSKVHKYNTHKGKQFLYVGSKTKHHKKITDKEIKEYLSNPKIKSKKLVVVADSLERVIRIMNSIDKDLYKEYFLMIDEIDSFQNDAFYRSRMETCLDIYKQFPKENRALVSATVLSFSDPLLNLENYTEYKYDVPSVRNIDLINTYNLLGSVIDKVKDILDNYPSDKIMIAYNAVSNCYDLAKHIVDHNYLPEDEVRILCSVNNKKSLKSYYAELESDQLPGRLTLVTSAYFSGFDLNEDFHLISVSDGTSRIQTLSDHKLKQIAGRCRETLLSETVIFKVDMNPQSVKTYTKDELINAAKNEIKALECLDKHFSSDPILRNTLSTVRELVTKSVGLKDYQFVRIDAENQLQVSYLNIDASLEMNRVKQELYIDKNALWKVLKEENHIISPIIDNSKTDVVDNSIIKQSRDALVQVTIQQIEEAETTIDVEYLLSQDGLIQRQKDVIMAYLSNQQFLDKKQLIARLKVAGKGRDLRKLNNFTLSALFATLHPKNFYRTLVDQHFKIGNVYTNTEILNNWNKVIKQLNIYQGISSKVNAVKFTNLHFKTNRLNNGKFKISDIVPLKTTGTRPEENILSIKNIIEYSITVFNT